MELEYIQGYKDDLPHILDNQQNYENSVPHQLSFLDGPFCALGKQVSIIRQDAENGHSHYDDRNGEKHPCAPPVQRAGGNKKQHGVKRHVKGNTSNDLWNGHLCLGSDLLTVSGYGDNASTNR